MFPFVTNTVLLSRETVLTEIKLETEKKGTKARESQIKMFVYDLFIVWR